MQSIQARASSLHRGERPPEMSRRTHISIYSPDGCSASPVTDRAPPTDLLDGSDLRGEGRTHALRQRRIVEPGGLLDGLDAGNAALAAEIIRQLARDLQQPLAPVSESDQNETVPLTETRETNHG